ncbi:MAG: acyltransferase family protein [Eubacterium sp.]
MTINIEKSDEQITIRESGIELFKIVAIFLIIISHVVLALCSKGQYTSYTDFVIDLSVATTSIQHFILILFYHFGVWGNTIFFVCSAWFLLNSSKFKIQKWLFMLIEVWTISIIILIISYILRHGNISGNIIIRSLFPNIFANNWYLTCYLLFYPIHPLLNMLINHMSKHSLLRLSLAMFILYCCFNSIKGNLFFTSHIILWITIYFVMAYIQLYLNDFANNKKKNCFLLIVCTIGFIGIILITNITGLHISSMQNKMFHWATNCNPFLITMTIALFNIIRNIHFKNTFINYVSSLSLLMYLTHNNLIIQAYYLPYIMNYAYVSYGYNHIVLLMLIIALFVFIVSLISSVVYDKTMRKLVKKISNLLYPFLRNSYLRIEHFILKLH